MRRRDAISYICLSIFILIVGMFSHRFFWRKYSYSLVSYRSLISEISEVIIPATNTPGAKEANVNQYIVSIIENCITIKEKNTLIRGLADLEDYCQREFDSTFSKCNNERKVFVLKYFEQKGSFSNPLMNKIKKKVVGRSFFELMKDLTVSGYCTSMLGATKGLAYDFIPLNYVACIPYLKGQRSWATK